MANYIQWIREQVGHQPIILNFAAAFILNEQGKILLQKREDSHKWGLPGGAIELGESAEDAMHREVLEETGLRVSVEDFLGVYTQYFDEYPNGDQAQSIAFFFICSIESGTLRIDVDDGETLDLQFFSPASAPRLFNRQSQEALNDFIQGKRGVCR
jgi:mutator protein MutT